MVAIAPAAVQIGEGVVVYNLEGIPFSSPLLVQVQKALHPLITMTISLVNPPSRVGGYVEHIRT
jgi:hypothetical protein